MITSCQLLSLSSSERCIMPDSCAHLTRVVEPQNILPSQKQDYLVQKFSEVEGNAIIYAGIIFFLLPIYIYINTYTTFPWEPLPPFIF